MYYKWAFWFLIFLILFGMWYGQVLQWLDLQILNLWKLRTNCEKSVYFLTPFPTLSCPQPSKGPVLRARRRQDWYLSKPPVQILWSWCSCDHLPGAPTWSLACGLRGPPIRGRRAQQERVQWRRRWTRVTERTEETERGILEKGEMFHDKMEVFFFLSLSPFSLPFALSFS